MKIKQSALEKLFETMEKHPELPVVPMVSSEVVPDDEYAYYMGNFSDVRIEEIIISRTGEVVCKADHDILEALEKILSYEELEAVPDSQDGLKEAFNSLPWKEVITIYISAEDE